jgi:hypothetical protein
MSSACLPKWYFPLDFHQVFVCVSKHRRQRITVQNFTFNFRKPCGLYSVTLHLCIENGHENLFPARNAVLLMCVYLNIVFACTTDGQKLAGFHLCKLIIHEICYRRAFSKLSSAGRLCLKLTCTLKISVGGMES